MATWKRRKIRLFNVVETFCLYYHHFLFLQGLLMTFTEAATRGVLQKMCSQRFRKIHRKTPMPESLFQ